jgi:hypothetical protein
MECATHFLLAYYIIALKSEYVLMLKICVFFYLLFYCLQLVLVVDLAIEEGDEYGMFGIFTWF